MATCYTSLHHILMHLHESIYVETWALLHIPTPHLYILVSPYICGNIGTFYTSLHNILIYPLESIYMWKHRHFLHIPTPHPYISSWIHICGNHALFTHPYTTSLYILVNPYMWKPCTFYTSLHHIHVLIYVYPHEYIKILLEWYNVHLGISLKLLILMRQELY